MKIELLNVNTNKLHDELIKANVVPLLVESLGETTWITLQDSDVASANAVVESHDPTPIQIVDAKTQAVDEINKATTVSALKSAMIKFVNAE